MSAATEKQNNGDVATVEKVAADAVKEDLKTKPAVEDSKSAAVVSDNGTASKDTDAADEEDATDVAPAKEHVKGTKRPAEAKHLESKKAKKETMAADVDSDGEEILDDNLNEGESDIESDEYDIPYEGEEDDIEECEDDDDENDDGSGSDDQA
uniref:Uncharacterized protein n=1 Tax=Glossina austeni TaxID=7395 RepID=A0A1A9V6W3_GLOAU